MGSTGELRLRAICKRIKLAASVSSFRHPLFAESTKTGECLDLHLHQGTSPYTSTSCD